jgi:hypothetical protein
MRPEDLSECLLTHGFYYGDDDIGMGQPIERVRNEEDLAAWRGTLTRGFGEDPVEAEWISERYRDWAWATRGRSVTNSEGWAGSRWPPLHCSWA